MKQLWAIEDKKKGLAKQINAKQMADANKKGYGIFLSVNSFLKNSPRREENISSFDSFYADFDDGTKEKQLEMISKCPRPTSVVESKNGFHCYWKIKDNMIKEQGEYALGNYKLIQQLIVDCTGADKSVKDAARVLRLPDTYHLKGEPFLVKEIYTSKAIYHSYDMLNFFSPAFSKKQAISPISVNGFSDGQFWDNITRYGAVEGLRKISGAEELRGDTFEVTNNQIYVNGEFTSSWIDDEGNIGSHGNGGPTIVQWIMWYGHDKGTAAAIIKKYIPEIEACAITLNF